MAHYWDDWKKKECCFNHPRENTNSSREKKKKEGRKKKKMIYRKWSLLTGPPAILGGLVGGLIVFNYVFFPEDPFRPKPKNPARDPSNVQTIGK